MMATSSRVMEQKCACAQRAPLRGAAAIGPSQGQSSHAIPDGLRASMERRFHADFSGVRVHADAGAGRSALEIGARAITQGNDLYFAPGHFRPESAKGRALLAHELTHVVQQRNGRVPRNLMAAGAVESHGSLEREAEQVETETASSEDAVVLGRAPDDRPQSSVGETMQAIREAARGGIQAAADWVVSQFAGEDGLIAKAAEVRRLVASVQSLVLSRETVALMARVYRALRRDAPSWLPIPDLEFDSRQGAIVLAGVAIGAAEVLLFLCIVIALVWLLQRADPKTRRAQDRAVEEVLDKIREATRPRPVPEPEPDPNRRPRPTEDPPPVPLACTPTGLTPLDPIPMVWYKPVVDDWYPPVITLGGHGYDRDTPTTLPRGEPIGVDARFWPRAGKKMQLLPTLGGDKRSQFRSVLQGYGFDWTGLQADHVQDLEWSGDDDFPNLWPMDQSANMSAGARNNQQTVGVCMSATGPFVMRTIQELKRSGFYGRWFEIRNVSR